MQERKFLISRVIKSERLFTVEKKTAEQRVGEFVAAQQQVVASPFSLELSIKALGKPIKDSKDPSADNKEKRKKAKGKFERYGIAIFDPNAKAKPGQYFEVKPRKINQDGQLGDVANIGWLDRRETIAPKDLVREGELLISNNKSVPIRKIPAKKNPRTGALEVKSLGKNIGRAVGNIGQAAARAIGIVVDGGGKFRCPPGVPAANQFTDEIGSNCFDFSPLVARKLLEIAKKFGQPLQEQLGKINSASPFERDNDFKLVPRGQGVSRRDTSLRSSGGLLGPDGKPIPAEVLAELSAAAELAAAERELSRISGVTSREIDPDTYEKEFKDAFRKAFPGESNSAIEEMANVAAARERMRDNLRREQRQSIEIIKSLGIEVDENNPSSIQRGIGLALAKLKDEEFDGKKWGLDLTGYYGEDFDENPEVALLEYQRRVSEIAFLGVYDSILKETINGFSEEELESLVRKYPKLQKEIIQAVLEGRNPLDVYPDDPKAQKLLALVMNANVKAVQYENGILMQLINARRETPELVGNLESIVHGKHNADDPFFAEMGIGSEGGTNLIINLHGMLLFHPPESLNPSDNYMYEPASTAGTEIEKLNRIGEVITDANRTRLLGSYMDELAGFDKTIKDIQSGNGFLTEGVHGSFGGTALGQFVIIHELTHSRQLILAREVIMAQNPGMTNVEAMEVVYETIMQGRNVTPDGMTADYGAMMEDPRVLVGAVENMSEIVSILINNKVGGAYGPSHYYVTHFLNEAMKNSSNKTELIDAANQILMREQILRARGNPGDGAEIQGLNKAFNKLNDILGQENIDDFDAFRLLKRQISTASQVTYMEMQADLSAAVKLGLIKETPEIKIFLGPLALDGDLPEIRKNIIAPLPASSSPTRREKIKKLAKIAKAVRGMTLADIADSVIEESDKEERRKKAAINISDRDMGLMSTGLASAVQFDGRGSASRWGKNVRNAILGDATPEQARVVEDGRWRDSPDLKERIGGLESNEYGMRMRLLLGGDNDEWFANSLDETLIPFVEIIDESKLPNSVAAEIVIPGGALRSGSAISVDTHFTGVLKDNESLGTIPEQSPFSEGQRLIINVPEGYSGLPDYTPGTDKSEVGSIILPPGEIEIVGLRDDGVAVGRVVSQISADNFFEAKKEELKKFDSKLDNLSDKITIGKAINRLERKQESRSAAALRSSSAVDGSTVSTNTRNIPAEKSSKTKDVLERLKAKNINFGRISPKRREEKRNEVLKKLRAKNSGSGSVEMDSRKFESPEESAIRVSSSIDNAVGLIEQGKLEGLAPEVAEIMKGKSPDEIRQILIGSAKDFVGGLDKRPRFRIRSTPVRDVQDSREIPFMGFLKTGVYKTTYDADSVGVAAASAPNERREYEEMLGIPELEDSSLRPAHGFLTHQDQIEFEDKWKQGEMDAAEKRNPNAVSFRDLSVIPPPSGSNNSAKDSDGNLRQVDAVPFQYGDTEIILRTDSAARSVATMGDSFNGHRTPFALDGSSTDEDLLDAMTLNRGIALEKDGVSASSQRRISNLLNASVGKNHSQTTDFSRPGDDTKRDYVEAIVAGSFDMSDVEEIKISSDFQDTQIRALTKVDAKEVSEKHIRELLTGVLPPEDFASMLQLIADKSTDPQIKKAAQELREVVAARVSLIRERSGRRDIRRQVAQRSSGGTSPKVAFMNRDGINIDDPRTFSRTATAVGMGENHEIDDVVKYGTARAVRDILERSGKAISSKESFAALKPEEVKTPQIGLRSSGGQATMSRQELFDSLLSPVGDGKGGMGSQSLRIAEEAKKRDAEIRNMLGRAAMAFDPSDAPQRRRTRRIETEFLPKLVSSAELGTQGRQNTTRLAQREALRSSGSIVPARLDMPGEVSDAQQEKRWKDYIDELNIPTSAKRERVTVTTVEEGVLALLDGKEVDMPDVAGAHTLLDELGRIVGTLKSMYENGEIDKATLDNAVFDLCQVTVSGVSAFCLGNKGIPRYLMPQAGGKPREGSKAAELLVKQQEAAIAAGKTGKDIPDEVDATEEFLKYLSDKGIKPRNVDSDGNAISESWDSSKLKATQRDMQGQIVVGMMQSSKQGTYNPGKKAIFVSRDGYVVDGHHRWAAQLGNDFENGILGDSHEMTVIVLDAPISEILAEANRFTKEFGILQKTVAERAETTQTSRDILDIVAPKLVDVRRSINDSIDASPIQGLRSSGARSVLVEGEGGRSSFRTRRSGASLRSSGAARTTREKLENGPTNLPNGRGADGTPRTMDIDSAKIKFGKSPRAVRRHFQKEYGVKVEIASLPNDVDASETRSTYGAIQALDDLFVNTPGLSELIKRDSVEVKIGPDDISENMGGFRPKGKFFTKTKIGKKGAKTEITINTTTIGDKSLSSLNNFASRFNSRNQSGREENNIANLYARAAIPEGFEVLFPGEDSPDYENWKKVSGDVQQRIAYAATVHEFAHYLDFSQREKSDASIPSMASELLNYGKEKQPVSRDAFLSSGSGLSSVDGAQSVSAYGLSETAEKFAEAFTAWWLLSGTDTYAQPQGVRGARSAYSAQEEFRVAIAEAVTPLLDKLGPRVKSAKPEKNRTTVETTKLPDVALIYAISPYMNMLNGNKKQSGKIKSRPTGSVFRENGVSKEKLKS